VKKSTKWEWAEATWDSKDVKTTVRKSCANEEGAYAQEKIRKPTNTQSSEQSLEKDKTWHAAMSAQTHKNMHMCSEAAVRMGRNNLEQAKKRDNAQE
jgi:hypothetical protein